MEHQDWQLLHGLITRVLKLSSLQEQLTAILDVIVKFHGSEQGIISLCLGECTELTAVVSRGLSQDGVRSLNHIALNDGVWGSALRLKQRVVIEDIDSVRLDRQFTEVAYSEKFRSAVNTPFFEANGTPLGLVSIFSATPRFPDERELWLTDICIGQLVLLLERERSARALRDEQERSHHILSSVKDGVMTLDSDFRVMQINAEGLRIDGRPIEDLLGRTHWELWPGTEELPVGKAYKRAMRENVSVSLEQLYTHRGRTIWLEIQAFPIRDGLAVFYRDITTRKEAEIALREREEQLRLATEAAEVGLWDVDMVANTLFWPPSVKAMFGISPEKPVSMDDYYSGLHPDDYDATVTAFANACNPAIRSLYDVEYRTIGKEDKKIRWVAAKGRAIFNNANRCVRIIGTAIDVTKRKQNEEALRQSEERLRESDRKKDEFLAMLAHELRNPLAPITTAAEMLRLAAPTDSRTLKAADVIVRQVKHMTALVNDLLDVSRVTRGLVQLEKAPVDIKSAVSSAIEQSRSLIEGRNHSLTVKMDAAHSTVDGDRTRLVQVVANLLNNAAKYTPQGGSITLEVQNSDNFVAIRVQDDGIGIDNKLLPHIFDLFTQAERTPDRAQGGLGIGLALVKTLVDLHEGSVSAESDGPGKGSTFAVTLPCASLQATSDAVVYSNGLTLNDTPLRIMIVDDNLDAAESLGALLEAYGHDVEIQTNPLVAFEAAKSQRPQVLILDIGLPDIDGYELARRLRNDPITRHACYVALTGYGQAHDKVLSKTAGFDHHLVKPVDLERLNQILIEVSKYVTT